MLGPTDPNRYYMWTGWDGNDGKGGGPVIANDELGYGWKTYPERLQAAGISWKIYQDIGVGLDKAGFWGWTSDPYIGNYGDNSLLYFFNYQNAAPGSPLYQGARTGTEVNKTRRVLRHPRRRRPARPAAERVVDRRPRGVHRASGVARRLRRLVHGGRARRAHQQPRGVVQDGPADHLRRERRLLRPRRRRRTPTSATSPGRSTVPLDNELFDGKAGTPGGSDGVVGPYGLGVRVPLLVVSPWSSGGWVCSETFDHTSLIRFIEARFGVDEPNITPWRRAVCGDLTSAFDFKSASIASRRCRASPTTSPTRARLRRATTRSRRQSDRSRPRSPACGRRVGSATASTSPSTPTRGKLNLAVENRGRLGVTSRHDR